MSLHCKLVPVQCQEHEYVLFNLVPRVSLLGLPQGRQRRETLWTRLCSVVWSFAFVTNSLNWFPLVGRKIFLSPTKLRRLTYRNWKWNHVLYIHCNHSCHSFVSLPIKKSLKTVKTSMELAEIFFFQTLILNKVAISCNEKAIHHFLMTQSPLSSIPVIHFLPSTRRLIIWISFSGSLFSDAPEM